MFDYIIGNPPYNDTSTTGANKKLWKPITKRCLEIGNVVYLITPKTYLQYLKNPCYVDHTANNYFDVGVDIVAWGVGLEHQTFYNKDSSKEEMSSLSNLRDATERDSFEYFEKMKKTPKEDRMFTRLGSESLHSPKKVLIVSTSKMLRNGIYFDSNESYDSKYVQYTAHEPKRVKEILLSDKFQELCKEFRRVYKTGFCNVMLYISKESFYEV